MWQVKNLIFLIENYCSWEINDFSKTLKFQISYKMARHLSCRWKSFCFLCYKAWLLNYQITRHEFLVLLRPVITLLLVIFLVRLLRTYKATKYSSVIKDRHSNGFKKVVFSAKLFKCTKFDKTLISMLWQVHSILPDKQFKTGIEIARKL